MNKIKVALIYNGKSGKGKIKENLADVIEKLYINNNKLELLVYNTQYSGHATKIVEYMDSDIEYVVCCGGDGTLSEVQQGMIKLNSYKPICYIPCGTVNDFARSIEISNNMLDNIGNFKEMYVEDFDCGKIKIDNRDDSEKAFTYVVAFGLFTSASYSTPQDIKNSLGKGAYVLEGLKELTNLKSHKVKITLDNKEVIEDTFLIGCVSNSKSVGGIKLYNSEVDMSDGLFEVILLKDFINNKQNLSIPLEIYLDNLVIKRTASNVKIESMENIDYTLDGEFGGSGKYIEIDNLHKRLSILKN